MPDSNPNPCHPLAEARGLNHIGIAVSSIEAARTFYEGVLGAALESIETVPEQKVRVAFYRLGTEGSAVRLELLEPVGEDSPVARFIEKRGEGIHHLAFTVDDIEGRLKALQSAGVRLIDASPRPGAHHTRIAFLHPKASHGVLTELCEPQPAGL